MAEDGYYKCDLEACGTSVALVGYQAPSKVNTDTLKSDWIIYSLDVDQYATSPRCVPPTAADIKADPSYTGAACK